LREPCISLYMTLKQGNTTTRQRFLGCFVGSHPSTTEQLMTMHLLASYFADIGR
jgi:hypothetical protein